MYFCLEAFKRSLSGFDCLNVSEDETKSHEADRREAEESP